MPEEKKAFDLQELEARLKAKGLPAAEGLAKVVVSEVFAWIKDGVEISPSKVDDFALGVLVPLETYILDKIDGIS